MIRNFAVNGRQVSATEYAHAMADLAEDGCLLLSPDALAAREAAARQAGREAVDQARAEERAALDRVNTLANLYDEAGRTRTVRTSWADIANEIRSAARITRSQP